jgi:PAS domain S-box-containing protein
MTSVGKTRLQARSHLRRRPAAGARRIGQEAQRILAEALADAVISIDPRSRILFVNPSTQRLFGYSASELLGRSLTLLMPERLRARHEASLARYVATGDRQLDWQAVELTARHKDGHEIPVEISFGESRQRGRQIFTGVVRDITERKRAEALQSALYRVAERSQAPTDMADLYTGISSTLRELMDARGFHVVLRDEASGALSCPYFAGEVRLGPPAQPLADGLTEHVLRTGEPLLAAAGAEGPASRNWLGVPLKAGEKTLGVLVVQARPGSPGYGEREKEILRFVARQVVAALDRHRAEQELKRTVSVLRATLDSTADGILVVDGDGRVVSFNQRFAQLWRIPRPMLAMRDDVALLAYVLDQLKQPEQFLSKVRELYLRPEAEAFDELEFKDGRIFERYSIPHRQDGLAVGRVWSFRDVTRTKDLEQRLRQSHRLEAVRRLAGSAAHDFNDLLTVIASRGELALRALPGEESLRRHLDAILGAAGRATSLTHQLLAFSGRQVLPPVEALPSTPVASEAPRGSETVLLVEGHEAVRMVAREVLEAQGYDVLEASGGAEALLVQERHGVPAQLLVAAMPIRDMDGPELARRLATAWPAMKVLFVSDRSDDAVAHDDALARNAALLRKPFTPDALARKVREVLDASSH